MIDVLAGILEQDLEVIVRRATLAAPHVGWIHLDVADNTLVSNETFRDFHALGKNDSWQKVLKKCSGEAHLMVARPESYLEDLIQAGFTRVIAHVECVEPRNFIAEARTFECEVGLAIDADTDVEQVEPFFEELDTIMVMTVDAGFSSQPFRQDTIDKIKALHQEVPTIPIQVDGHIDAETAKLVVGAGATRLVSTSYIFHDEKNIAKAVELLKNTQ